MTAAAEDLWGKIASAGLTVGEMPAEETHTPWYVRVMLGIAGWLAASFFLGFFAALFESVLQSHAFSISVGFIVIAAAYTVFRVAPRNDFSAMFALAVSFAGQMLVAFGLLGWFRSGVTGAGPYWMLALIEAGLAVVMPNFIHRAVSAYAAAVAFAYACEVSGAHAVAAGIVAASVAFAWLQEGRFGKLTSAALPIGYGLTLALIQVEGMASWRHSLALLFQEKPMLGASPWIGEALVAAALLASVWMMLRRGGWEPGEGRTLLGLAATIVIGAASFKAPGIGAGLMIVLLGFGNGNRVLAGLGIASLLFYVSSYYYLLDATLLAKSAVLAATGAALLAVRWLVLNAVMPKESPDA